MYSRGCRSFSVPQNIHRSMGFLMTRRSHGEGCIYERKDGRWVALIPSRISSSVLPKASRLMQRTCSRVRFDPYSPKLDWTTSDFTICAIPPRHSFSSWVRPPKLSRSCWIIVGSLRHLISIHMSYLHYKKRPCSAFLLTWHRNSMRLTAPPAFS